MEEESALHTLTYTLSGEIIIRLFFVIYPFFGLVGWSLTSSPVHNDIRRVPWMHAPEIVDYKNSGVFFFLHYPISWIFWLSSSLGILKLVRQSSNPMWTCIALLFLFTTRRNRKVNNLRRKSGWYESLKFQTRWMTENWRQTPTSAQVLERSSLISLFSWRPWA